MEKTQPGSILRIITDEERRAPQRPPTQKVQTMTEYTANRPNRAPTHPGAILREDVLPALGIGVTEMAQHLHVTRQQLHRVLAEDAGISPEMAIRVGKLCGNGPDLWMNMQLAYDLWHAQHKLGRRKIAAIPTLQVPPPDHNAGDDGPITRVRLEQIT
jgi:antitoxin HigA-1